MRSLGTIAGLGHTDAALRTGRLLLVSAKARSHVSPVAIRRALYADRWVPRYRAAIQRVLNKQVRQVARESLITTPEPERHITQWSEELAREKKRWIYAIVLEGYELAGLEVDRLSERKAASDVRAKADPSRAPVVELGRERGGEFLLQGDFEDIDRWVDTTSLGEAQTSAKKLEQIWKDAVASRDPVTGVAWTTDQIAKEILRRGLTDNVHRADMLAKTGAIWSVNEGAQQRYRAAGVTAEQWLTTKDDALCPYCRGMNGVIVRTDEPFWPAGSEMANPEVIDTSLKLPYEVQHPPLHPRCRCSLIPVVGSGAEAQLLLAGGGTAPEIRKPRAGVARKPVRKPRKLKPKPKISVRQRREKDALRKVFSSSSKKFNTQMIKGITDAPRDLRVAVSKAPPIKKVHTSTKLKTGYYSPKNQNIVLTSASDVETMKHEFGHHMWFQQAGSQNRLLMEDAIRKESKRLGRRIVGEKLVDKKHLVRVRASLAEYNKRSRWDRTLNDIFGSTTNRRVGSGHTKKYLKQAGIKESEVFADLVEVYSRVDREGWRFVSKNAPDIARTFRQVLSNLGTL